VRRIENTFAALTGNLKLETALSCPLLLGHRGVRPVPPSGARSERLPAENTIAAFDCALANGCDGFEFDVRFTRDGRAAVCHDPQLDGKEISATNYADLLRGRNDLACLEDVLARFSDKAYLDIEVKVGGNEEAVVTALRASPPRRGYVISSFFPEVLLRLSRLDGMLPLGFICDRLEYLQLWTELPISTFIPQYELEGVSQQLMNDAHQRGLKVFTWTVNQVSDLQRLAAWGVDGLISDDPTLLSRIFPRSA
jgi:glycerophosphoryl diester phosphodiesterase